MPDSRREQILSRQAAILETVAARDGGKSSRNLLRMDDVALNSYVLFDGDEELTETELAPGVVGNICVLNTSTAISFSAPRADVGSLASAKLAAVQKAILNDATMVTLCGRARQLGPRYAGCSLSVAEGDKVVAELIVRFATKYVFKPSDL